MRFLTYNTLYTLKDMGDGGFLISGNARYCPVPTPCRLSQPVEVGKRLYVDLKRPDGRFRPILTTPVLHILEG